MTLHEGERLTYLRALGITQYVPLQAIPGALQLPPLEWSDAADAGEAELPATEPAVVPAAEAPAVSPAASTPPASTLPSNTVAGAMASLMQHVVSTPASAGKVAEAPPLAVREDSDIPQLDLSKLKPVEETPRTAPVKPAATQRFSLAVVTLPQQQARILVELAQPDAPGLSSIEFRLLGDLLRALGVKQDLSEGSVRPFRWPPVNNARIAADVSAARDGLLAFLTAAQAEQPVKKLLFLGTAPAGCFAQPEPATPFPLPELDNATGLFSHSLAALQQDWTLKPALWQQLQAFL